MSFHVGQKVVCVFAGGFYSTEGRWRGDVLELDRVYTVRKVYAFRNEPHLVLEEATNAAHLGYGYRARRFRPIQERKTDISIFTAMLTPSKRSVDA